MKYSEFPYKRVSVESKKKEMNQWLERFNTAESVSEGSGRGGGMDVVKSNIEKLGGNILVTSKLGEGTTFKISFPSRKFSISEDYTSVIFYQNKFIDFIILDFLEI